MLHELAEFVVIKLYHLIVLVVNCIATPKGPFLHLYILYRSVQISRQSDSLTFIINTWTFECGHRFGRDVLKTRLHPKLIGVI